MKITISSDKGDKPKPRTTSNSQKAGSEIEPLRIRIPKRPTPKAELQKKIQQADKQLLKASISMPAETSNSQTTENYPLTMGTDRKMIAPGSRDAPKFDSTRPHELRRFIRLMEDLWKEAGVTDDAQKKLMIGKYADEESEEEWTALDTFGAEHSWLAFKKELLENYPEAAAAERGTPARLRQLCSETREIKLGNLAALYAFRRAFLAEAKKLMKPPAAMANRELVELFISCLSESMASAVLQHLGNSMSDSKESEKTKEAEAEGKASSRRPEDKYDLEAVCKAAVQVSENSQGMFHLMGRPSLGDRGVFMLNQPISDTKALSQKFDELEGVQALERDRLVSLNKTMESRFSDIENMMKTLLAQSQGGASQGLCKGDCKSGNCKTHEAHSGPAQRWGGKPMENEKCFWCGLFGHFQADCEDLKSQIRSGNVKVNQEGKLRLKDGSFIPNYPAGATMKEKVERHYAKRPSQYYHGEYEEDDPVPSSIPRYPSQYLQTNETAERRRARLEKELDLKEREDALELRKLKLEREEKRLELPSGGSKAANLLELTDDELAAIKAARLGFH